MGIQIYIIGDIHTVTAFQLAGLEGVAATPDTAADAIDRICAANTDSIILITAELSGACEDRIMEINLSASRPVIATVPSVQNEALKGRSVLSYITEAVGLSI